MSERSSALPQYVIERDIPGAGNLTPDPLRAIQATSCSVLRDMGPQMQWMQSYVTGDRVYCVYTAPDEACIREHAQRGGFPADRISRIEAVIGPSTAN